MAEYVTLPQRIEELVAQHGVRGLARLLRTDPGYITRLRKGEKENPDDDLLADMGLRRVVLYERTSGVTVPRHDTVSPQTPMNSSHPDGVE